LDSFQQTEETNVPNADQVNLMALRVMVDVVVADIAAKSSFLSKSRNIFSHNKFYQIQL
tara:strand:- start:599 stop:775 length:177 start_codon:yes stop_codon:yes gene_type:complete